MCNCILGLRETRDLALGHGNPNVRRGIRQFGFRLKGTDTFLRSTRLIHGSGDVYAQTREHKIITR